ncbi:protein phosphatase inhibitor 2-like isoform X2 [Gigantopelta aegis]|uniref:protein phosphatase inhibitor 2-like isoform X2 n=1 Tax=Gigantopelta aegis TaxID=1735272 RepID=UPI001B88D25F|nr:protein phosphatase inhibitor 2-like isoform X2 [Gigantopelta aegis]
MAAEKRAAPHKGILKHTSSLDRHDPPLSQMAHQLSDEHRKQMKWDEMNILATNHPPDKDYGHMKIDEPLTPYSKYSDPEDEDMDEPRRGSISKDNTELDPTSLAEKLSHTENTTYALKEDSSEESNNEEEFMDEQQKEEHAMFEQKRKLHYNEFQAVQLAKRLMAEEEDDDDDANTSGGSQQKHTVGDSVPIDTSTHNSCCYLS